MPTVEKKFSCPVFRYLTLGPAACMNTNCFKLNRCTASHPVTESEQEKIRANR